MRDLKQIDTIVVHHSVTPASLDFSKTIASINNNHKRRFVNEIKDNPQKESMGLHIAYHFIVGAKGEIKNTRDLHDVGYHASGYRVNMNSIGICMIGDYDHGYPSLSLRDALKTLMLDLKRIYPTIKYIVPHRKFNTTKSCYG